MSKVILVAITLLLSTATFVQAQSTINLHLNNGNTIQIPLNTVDSITYTPYVQGSGVTFDGYNYLSIIFGNGQEWMAENLRTSHYANGDSIANLVDPALWGFVDTGAWVFYNHDSQLENPYGKLYNWFAVNDSRNVCPTDWHVPSDYEWSELINYLDPSADGGNSSNIAGRKLKSIGNQFWGNANDATNESGFSGFPGGYRYKDGSSFNFNGAYGYWWTSTPFVSFSYSSYVRTMTSSSSISRSYMNEEFGLSVRCIKN